MRCSPVIIQSWLAFALLDPSEPVTYAVDFVREVQELGRYTLKGLELAHDRFHVLIDSLSC